LQRRSRLDGGARRRRSPQLHPGVRAAQPRVQGRSADLLCQRGAGRRGDCGKPDRGEGSRGDQARRPGTGGVSGNFRSANQTAGLRANEIFVRESPMRGIPRAATFSLALFLLCLLSSSVSAQMKPLREINSSYPLGGSTSFFWVAYRSGAFEKRGLKLKPIFIRGSVAAIQSLLAKELSIQMEAGPAGVRAWARGAKEIVLTGAVGNKLDYILVTTPSIRKAEDLKGKKIAVSQIGASSDCIARYAVQQLGLNPERDVTILAAGDVGQRWAALPGGHLDATVAQPPYALRARKSGYPVLLDISRQEFQYPISAVF